MATAHSNVTKKRRSRAATPLTAATGACYSLLGERDIRIVERAFKVLEKNAVYRAEAFTTPGAVRDYLRLRLSCLGHEQFHVLWLDALNRLISFDSMFSGTLTQTSVYPREVVKAGLARNAAAAILAHNHPSGSRDPSEADQFLTRELKVALALVDIRVLDHFIVAGDLPPLSFAENGLL